MSESDKVDHHVKAWYGQPARWSPQGKTAEWPDHVLLDQGAEIDGADVLNLGCFFPEDEATWSHRARSWTAIDFAPGIIEHCRSLRDWPEHVKFEMADMRYLPYDDASFDIVTDFSSGDHLLREDWHKTIEQVHRVLRPAGLFLVCFANRDAFIKILKVSELGVPWAEFPEQFCEYGYVRTDTVEGMVETLESRGFTVVKRSHCNDLQLRVGVLAVKK